MTTYVQSDEYIRAAAERLLDPKDYSNDPMDDAHELAKAWLYEHRTDDEFATIEWLVGQGGKLGTAPVGNRYVDFMIFDDGDGFRQWVRLHEPDSDGSIVPDLFSKSPTGPAAGIGLVGKWPKTRSEVRILFEALGVKT